MFIWYRVYQNSCLLDLSAFPKHHHRLFNTHQPAWMHHIIKISKVAKDYFLLVHGLFELQ